MTVPCLCLRNALVARNDQPGAKIHKVLHTLLQHEGNLFKVPLHLIMSTTPMDLLHIGFTSIEMTMEPNKPSKVMNVWCFQDHFTKYVMVYVTPNQTAKTIAKFLNQGYISIFGALARLLSDHGANFMSSIIGKLLGMRKLQTMPFTP